MTRGRSIDWTDVLYMPCAIALYLILERWLSNSMAAGISAVLGLLVLDILTRQVSDKKELIFGCGNGRLSDLCVCGHPWLRGLGVASSISSQRGRAQSHFGKA